jgi:glycosyltransferase involved in cell wall biosynthesis
MKIILFANTDWFHYNFNLDLALSLLRRGDQVTLVSPQGLHAARLQELGLRWIQFPMARRSFNPFQEWITLIRLVRLYHREKPDLVHHFTVKCVLYGSLAARLLGIRPVVNTVTGLGYLFTEGEGGRGGLRRLVKILYHFLLRRTFVIFLNHDDREFFMENDLVDPDRMAFMRGSGVDISHFKPGPEAAGLPVVCLPGRLLWDKGVAEFVQAARLLKGRDVPVRFALVGGVDPGNPSSVPLEQVQAWVDEAVIEWWGWVEEMVGVYARSHIVCLPSYREGLPKTLVEAAACGRAIIASDVPGCREVVRHGENGLLVPVKDPHALAEAITLLVKDPALRLEMGARGRQMAVRDFSADQIISQTQAVYRSLFNSPG